MVNVIMIRNTYGGLEYLRNGCFYVTNHDRAIAPGGFGVNYTDAVACYNNMLAVKQFYRKTSDNPLLHIVVSYNEKSEGYYHRNTFKHQDRRFL